jgi:hypothetical protein
MAGKKDTAIDIVNINSDTVDFCIVGVSPLICESMNFKVLTQLLLPPAKKTAATKATSLKHDPYAEFRASIYKSEDPNSPTYIEHLAVAFKKCISSAAVDIPGASKAQIGRLLWANSERVPIYGTPKLMMSVVRTADINRTPDVRTRAVVPEWACRISIQYVTPILNLKSISNLLAASGMINGIGGWRPQKGSGNFGQFRVCSEDDADFQRILKIGRAEQVEAMNNPIAYSGETEELLEYFDEEIKTRGLKGSAKLRVVGE